MARITTQPIQGLQILVLLPTEPASGMDSTVSVMTPVVPGGVVDLSELDDEVVPSDGTKGVGRAANARSA